jgi:ADP-ribose pyrophosphatase YjhB (NUDIX family)
MAVETKKAKFELAIAFVKDEGLYCLVLETNEKSPHYDKWVAPTEGIEPGETPKYAAIRAMDEEAGIWGKITSGPYTKEKAVEDGFIRQHYFSAELLDDPDYGDKKRAFLSTEQIASKKFEGKLIAPYIPQIMKEMKLI